MTDLPIAWTLTPAELQSRGAQLLPGLVARAIGQVPVTNGFRWVFAPTEGLLPELVSKAGYSVAEEVPFFLAVFAIPAAVAFLVLWRATRG